jgi:hypothetical protein
LRTAAMTDSTLARLSRLAFVTSVNMGGPRPRSTSPG